jgi:hypothetical protein
MKTLIRDSLAAEAEPGTIKEVKRSFTNGRGFDV